MKANPPMRLAVAAIFRDVTNPVVVHVVLNSRPLSSNSFSLPTMPLIGGQTVGEIGYGLLG